MGTRNCKGTNNHTPARGNYRSKEELNPDLRRACRKQVMATRGCFSRALGVFSFCHSGLGIWVCFHSSLQPPRSSKPNLKPPLAVFPSLQAQQMGTPGFIFISCHDCSLHLTSPLTLILFRLLGFVSHLISFGEGGRE